MANDPTYRNSMRTERETMPPSTEELEGIERFETHTKDEDDFWAVVRHAAQAIGLGRK